MYLKISNDLATLTYRFQSALLRHYLGVSELALFICAAQKRE